MTALVVEAYRRVSEMSSTRFPYSRGVCGVEMSSWLVPVGGGCVLHEFVGDSLFPTARYLSHRHDQRIPNLFRCMPTRQRFPSPGSGWRRFGCGDGDGDWSRMLVRRLAKEKLTHPPPNNLTCSLHLIRCHLQVTRSRLHVILLHPYCSIFAAAAQLVAISMSRLCACRCGCMVQRSQNTRGASSGYKHLIDGRLAGNHHSVCEAVQASIDAS